MSGYVYAIMPVASDPLYGSKRDALVAAVQRSELALHLPLEVAKHEGRHRKDLMHDLQSATFVLADLSLARPSCYFEVGLAQALHARVILIAKRGTDIHQVFDRDGVRWYESMESYHSLVTSIMDSEAASTAHLD